MTRRSFAVANLLPLFAAAVSAQTKKSYTFRGKIESLDAASKSMSINGEKVQGWMDAMTMKYAVDGAEIFKTAKVGDSIEATVYDGDYVLHNVRVVKAGQNK